MPDNAVALSESLGDYLESIYHLAQERGVARAKDIAAQMGVRMASVTGALHALAERRLVNYDPYSLITLTPRGERVAKDLVRRHEMLARFFNAVLAIDAKTADRNACHIEHAIEPAVLERLVKFVEFIEHCPRASSCWRETLAAKGARPCPQRAAGAKGGAQ